jgi:hypothetical protein
MGDPLGEVRPNPDPPETEDHLFWPSRAQVVGRLSPNRYLELLRGNASRSLRAIFGEEIERHNRSYAVEKGHGSTSLGILRIQRKPHILVDGYGKLRLRISRPGRTTSLPVTDLRFVEADHQTIRADVVADVNARMRRGVEVLLMVGLSRAFRKDGDDRERHWLQVNGICMADRPLDDSP